jgi:ADP-ribosylglycohydrolase
LRVPIAAVTYCLPVDAQRLLGGGPEGERAAGDFALCVQDWLARFSRRQLGQLVRVLADPLGDVRQGVAPLEAGQPQRVAAKASTAAAVARSSSCGPACRVVATISPVPGSCT